MNRRLKRAFLVYAMSAGLGMPCCAFQPSSRTHLEREVQQLHWITIPPHSHLVSQHAATIKGWDATADWEFQSDYSADAYQRWVTRRLREDFQIRQASGSYLRFTKDAQGDVETLSLMTAPSAGALQVTVKLDLYPD